MQQGCVKANRPNFIFALSFSEAIASKFQARCQRTLLTPLLRGLMDQIELIHCEVIDA